MYWPAQPHTEVDLLVEKHGYHLTVQVKTAAWTTRQNYKYLRCHTSTRKRKGRRRYDLLLVVHGTGVWEIPAALVQVPDLTLASTNPAYKSQEWDKFKRRLHAAEETL